MKKEFRVFTLKFGAERFIVPPKSARFTLLESWERVSGLLFVFLLREEDVEVEVDVKVDETEGELADIVEVVEAAEGESPNNDFKLSTLKLSSVLPLDCIDDPLTTLDEVFCVFTAILELPFGMILFI